MIFDTLTLWPINNDNRSQHYFRVSMDHENDIRLAIMLSRWLQLRLGILSRRVQTASSIISFRRELKTFWFSVIFSLCNGHYETVNISQ